MKKWEPQWHLIEFGQCPRCYKSLLHDAGWAAMKCPCGFSMNDSKFKAMKDRFKLERMQREKMEADLLRQNGPTDQEVIDEFKKKWQ